MLKNTWRK